MTRPLAAEHGAKAEAEARKSEAEARRAEVEARQSEGAMRVSLASLTQRVAADAAVLGEAVRAREMAENASRRWREEADVAKRHAGERLFDAEMLVAAAHKDADRSITVGLKRATTQMATLTRRVSDAKDEETSSEQARLSAERALEAARDAEQEARRREAAALQRARSAEPESGTAPSASAGAQREAGGASAWPPVPGRSAAGRRQVVSNSA